MPIIASNFKTNHTRATTASFVKKIDEFLKSNSISSEILVFPTATALDKFETVSNLTVGVQNAYGVQSGSYTGEIGTCHRITSYNVCYTKLLRCLLSL